MPSDAYKYIEELRRRKLLVRGVKAGVVSGTLVSQKAIYDHYLMTKSPTATAHHFEISVTHVHRIIKKFK